MFRSKAAEIFRFELALQLRRAQTWLFFAAMGVIAFVALEANFLQDARNGRHLLNSPFVIAFATVIAGVFWLLGAAAVAGEAAARDVRTRMHPLLWTAPIAKMDYLGGRFFAAFAVNALILLAVPAGILLSVHAHGDAAILGPFRPAAYLAAYGCVALPNALIATAIQFSFAALGRRAMAAYLASLLLLVTAYLGGTSFPLLDPMGVVTIGRNAAAEWTPLEKNTRLVGLESAFLWNRLLWLGIAGGMLAFTHVRFRFAHVEGRDSRRRARRAPSSGTPTPALPAPRARRTFGLATRARQALAIATGSFAGIAKSWGALLLLALVAILALFSVEESMQLNGVPVLPRTDYVLHALTVPEIPPARLILPLVILFWSGELVWRERDARMHELIDTAPVPEAVLLLGKFLGLALVVAACMAIRMAAGIFVQLRAGNVDVDVALYLKILFGLQFADALLFALLALVIHVVVNQKYVGHLVAFLTFALIAAASASGIGPELLVYGSDPGWSYTDLRGFGASLAPFLEFELYWTAWAVLLAVAARLLWPRGHERTLRSRLRLAGRRFAGPAALVAAAAAALVVIMGGWLFANANDVDESWRAEYERRYGRYRNVPQPRLTATNLQVELHPERRTAEIRGTYQLVNRGATAVDAVHVATVPQVTTRAITFDRTARTVLADEQLGHRIYALAKPLRPGESLRLGFDVRIEPRAFRGDAAIVANGTYFRSEDWLPAIGYQTSRELLEPAMRSEHGLPPRPIFRSLYDAAARRDSVREEPMDFAAVIGTSEDQVAVAPGALRRTWTRGGRRYFHYATDAPIKNEYAILSARYAVREARWNDVAIRILHNPKNGANVERILRAVQASLDLYGREFRPYPQSFVAVVERPGFGMGMHADAGMLTFTEAFALLHPEGNPRAYDLPFSVVAHEMAHQWWGSYLAHARVEGSVLLSEALAQYCAYQVVKETYGEEHLRRLLLREHREEEETPRARGDVPLLRGTDRYHRYRKGPWAMYAFSEYAGAERVHEALRRLLAKHAAGSLLTTLDLYRELESVTPPSLQSLLHDLFAANTFWELATERASATRVAPGKWQVTLDVRARKVVVDERGLETEVPMDDRVEVGVFAAGPDGRELYLRRHRIRSGRQTITVTVTAPPGRAGLDPRLLLIDRDRRDNVAAVAPHATGDTRSSTGSRMPRSM